MDEHGKNTMSNKSRKELVKVQHPRYLKAAATIDRVQMAASEDPELTDLAQELRTRAAELRVVAYLGHGY